MKEINFINTPESSIDCVQRIYKNEIIKFHQRLDVIYYRKNLDIFLCILLHTCLQEINAIRTRREENLVTPSNI
jgi:hypothetical protein